MNLSMAFRLIGMVISMGIMIAFLGGGGSGVLNLMSGGGGNRGAKFVSVESKDNDGIGTKVMDFLNSVLLGDDAPRSGSNLADLQSRRRHETGPMAQMDAQSLAVQMNNSMAMAQEFGQIPGDSGFEYIPPADLGAYSGSGSAYHRSMD